MSGFRLRLKNDVKVLREAFGIDKARAREIHAFLEELLERHPTKSGPIEEVWNREDLSFPEKIYATYVLGYYNGYAEAVRSTSIVRHVIIFMGEGELPPS